MVYSKSVTANFSQYILYPISESWGLNSPYTPSFFLENMGFGSTILYKTFFSKAISCVFSVLRQFKIEKPNPSEGRGRGANKACYMDWKHYQNSMHFIDKRMKTSLKE
jgi:hypothetical protein